MKKAHVFLSALGILVIGASFVLAFYFNNQKNNEDRFSVSGSGTVYAKADIANITIGLKTETKKTAAEATKDSTEKMNEIVKAVKDLGVEEKDIKTTNYYLNPVYNWTEQKGQQLIGYEVSQNVTLKVRDLGSIGDIIARTTEKGANQIGGISFTIDDEYELRNEARALAIEKAKAKAEMIAQESGMELGKIKSVLENSYQPVIDYAYSNARKEMISLEADQAAGVAAPSIESGQNEIRVEVTLVYEGK